MNAQKPFSKEIPSTNSFLQGAKDCAPTLFGYMSIGIAFGIVGTASGLSIIEIAALSIFVYAGSAQFIICALLVAGATLPVIITTTFIVNLRHFLLSLTLAPYFTKESFLRNIGFGALLTDESFGVASTRAARDGRLYAKWMDGLNLTAYLCWAAACTAGAILGQWISNPHAFGLDYALIAMFIALLVLQLEQSQSARLKLNIFVVLLVVVSMIVFSFFVSGHIAVLLSTCFAATIGVVLSNDD